MPRELAFLVILGAVSALQPSDSRAGLLHLLTQRSVQTNVYYLTNFHDEPKAKWLAKYREPVVSLEMDRISDRSVQPRYHGLDAYCQEDDEAPIDYLRDMMTAEPVEYKVRYLVGTPEGAPRPDASGAPEGFAETTSAAMGMWSNPAAASRRNNPFLERSKKYIEYDETIVPAKIAQSLMRTREQLAREWAWDLRSLLSPNAALESSIDGTSIQVPGMDEDCSPLRSGNKDLCARLATRTASIQALAELSQPEARYLSRKLAPKTEDDDRPSPPEIKKGDQPAYLPDPIHADLKERICDLQTYADALGDHSSAPGAADRFLEDIRGDSVGSDVDPAAVASKIITIRDALVRDWSEAVVGAVADEHALVCREALEAQFVPDEDN
jgi:hypothetical protein